ncbi:MAG: type II toxin-antitoxin system VapC family toxin [Deltaproteobacteria bacterium]|nr:type II toxin-antitoxin system VapC family toxin [Deltaproteobacteria bacterium]
MDYITDTHSLVWYFTDDSRLSNKALQAFQPSEEKGIIFVPAVVLAEIMFIARKGRITLSFEDTLNRIEESENFEIVPLNTEILRTANKIEADMEMHDRLIVATALWHNASLITKDETLRESGIVSTIW